MAHGRRAAADRSDAADENEDDRHQRGRKDRPAIKYIDVPHQGRLIGDQVVELRAAGIYVAKVTLDLPR